MPPRLETEPGVFRDCEPHPWSMGARQRIVDAIADPATQKLLIVRWGMRGEITQDEAHQLLVDNGLEGA